MLGHENQSRVKQGLHATQTLFIFVTWCLTLAILTKSGYSGGQVAFIFALCFATVPALIYQVAVPIFPRARRFNSVYAYAVVDILFVLLWFSAAVAVAVWTSQGINQAKDTDKDADGTCNHFAFGDASKCNVSRADAAFAFFICFLFAGTSWLSILMIKHYRQTGEMPGTRKQSSYMSTGDVMGKGAWSANVEEHEDDRLDGPDERRRYGQPTEEDTQGLLNARPTYDLQTSDPHPGSQISLNSNSHNPDTTQHHDNHVPSALSPDGYENDRPWTNRLQQSTSNIYGQPNRPLDFPTGNYDRV